MPDTMEIECTVAGSYADPATSLPGTQLVKAKKGEPYTVTETLGKRMIDQKCAVARTAETQKAEYEPSAAAKQSASGKKTKGGKKGTSDAEDS